MPVINSLTIKPYVALYSTLIADANITVGQSTREGRTEIVLDFNSGDGLYYRDFETSFSWPLSSDTILFTWQPTLISLPENTYNRATDWLDAGSTGAKWVQGILIEADSFNVAKVFQLQDSDTLAFHPLVEVGAGVVFNKQSTRAFSVATPFVAHLIRVVTTDGVPWRVWNTQLVTLPYPEIVTDFVPDFDTLGTEGAKFIQGFLLEADTQNVAKAFTVQSGDDLSFHVPLESPATFNGQSTKAFSFPTPFVAHGVRLRSADSTLWRKFNLQWIFKPYPEIALNWETELTALGGTGWQQMFQINIEYLSTAAITLTFSVDSGNGSIAPAPITIPSSGGVQAKLVLIPTANKWKLLGVKATSSSPFRLFSEGMQFSVKSWGVLGAYKMVQPYRAAQPIGGDSAPGASV
jgi:hypothetical protein